MPREPGLGPAPATAHYAPTDAPLYRGEPKGTDVEQRRLGDCFFLSSLASLAQRRPRAIEEAIARRADGTYTVRFYRKAPAGGFEPYVVDIDGALPEVHGEALYARFPRGGELWVPLLEKAYAEHLGSYKVLDRGGVSTTAMEALTGQPAHAIWLDLEADADKVWQRIHDAVHAGKLTTAATFDQSDLRKVLAKKIKAGKLPAHAYDPATFDYKDHGLVGDHEYTLWGVEGPRDGGAHRAIVLRNPWGHFEPRGDGDGKDDGIFALPFDRFMVELETASIGG
jgi:calpain-15